jgi:putative transposase
MLSFIDAHRNMHGVEPICKQLPIAPSTYYAHKAREIDADHIPPRVQRDMALKPEIQHVWDENFRVYGARKVWLQLNREAIEVARCKVERLMRDMGLQGAVRAASQSRPRSATRPSLVRWIGSIATSRLSTPTSCGYRISPM